MSQRDANMVPWLLRVIAPLVPRQRRRDWLLEWCGELARHGSQVPATVGPLRHALTLRLHDLESWLQDAGFACRTALARPGFSVAVALTLALGIGANTAVFSLINGVLLAPLPFPDAKQLYVVFEQDSSGSRQLASYPTYRDWRERSETFAELSYVHGTGLIIRTADRSSSLLSAFVTDNFFATLGVVPVLGRSFVSDDFLPAASPVVMLSEKTWRTAFRSDPSIVGAAVTLGNFTTTVVGVLPRWFALPQWTPAAGTDVWLPMNALPPPDRAALMQRDFHADSRLIGRVDPDVGLAQAHAELNGIAAAVASEHPEVSGRFARVELVPLRDLVVGDVAPRLLVLALAVLLVLLISCVNLANLVMARAAARRKEFAIRASLGAGRARLFRQLFTESLVLGAIGGGLGVFTAFAAVFVIRARAPNIVPRFHELAVDGRVLAVSVALTLITVAVLAMLSSREATRSDLAGSLRHGVRGNVAGKGSHRWFVAVQVALSMVLLVGAGLLGKSLVRLSGVDAGFNDDRLVVLYVYPRFPQYESVDAVLGLYREVASAVEAVPGVTEVGLVNHAPFGGGGITSRASRTGDPRVSGDETLVWLRTVSAGYFSMMGIPILSGREFTDIDLSAGPGLLIVNETFARRWGVESPVGHSLTVLKGAKERPDFGEPLFGSVVGVVGDIKHFGLDVPPAPVVYVPYTHNVWAHMFLVVRTATRAEGVLRSIEESVRSVEPNLPLEGLGMGAVPMSARLGYTLGPRRLVAALVGLFALVALGLAIVGMYGVTAYAVASEKREIGIRMALGASASTVIRAVFLRYFRATVIGLLVGVMGSLAVTRAMTGLLYQVEPHDPLTFVVVTVSLVLATGLACYTPARRVTTLDPVNTLRIE